MRLTDFEWSAIEALVWATVDEFALDRESIRVTSRQHTGVGFYTNILVPGVYAALQSTRMIGPIYVEIEGLPLGAVAMLYPEPDDSMLLEVVTNGSEDFPEIVTSFKLLA